LSVTSLNSLTRGKGKEAAQNRGWKGKWHRKYQIIQFPCGAATGRGVHIARYQGELRGKTPAASVRRMEGKIEVFAAWRERTSIVNNPTKRILKNWAQTEKKLPKEALVVRRLQSGKVKTVLCIYFYKTTGKGETATSRTAVAIG